jgi:ankyrin repeat protein
VRYCIELYYQQEGRFAGSKSARRNRLLKKPKQPWFEKPVETKDPDLSWFHRSCLYGHKNNLKKIVAKYKSDIEVNNVVFEGNTPLHLAILGGHLSIVQILMSNFSKKLNVTIMNDDGDNPIDLAVIHYKKDILNVLVKSIQPNKSSLIKAIKCNYQDLAAIIHDKLQKMFKDDISVKSMFERYFELNKEVDKKTLSKERLEACMKNIEAYKTMLCNYLSNRYVSIATLAKRVRKAS